MQKLSTLVAGALALSFSAHLSAQLSPVLVRSFVDTFAGGNGNIGITQDEAGFAYYVVAFQNPQTVHTFDIIGTPLTTFTSATCSPALPTPNDITYDPATQTLWLVENGGGGTVLQMDLQGNCLGGWSLSQSLVNAVGICVDRQTGTLFISHTGGVVQYDMAGNQLSGGFSFMPASGSAILSGITHVPATDRFLITQSGGSSIYEVDRGGSLISTTQLSGIGNTQGLHYNPLAQELTIIDNSLSTAFVFSLPFCSGSLTQQGVGCADGSGLTVWLGASGCADIGNTVLLESFSGPNALPMLFAGGVSNSVASGVALPFDLGPLGAPSCWLYTSSEAVIASPQVGNKATLPFPIPNNQALAGATVFLQAVTFDITLASPLQIATSNSLTLIAN
tara:strand:- start:31 stop:1206 length:1176 start_codon:yes stop_codon:yes gene_type:complete